MSALFCLFLWFRAYPEKLQEYIQTFYKIRYILEELYVAVIPIISRLMIYIDQLNKGIMKIGLFHGSKLGQTYLCSIDKSWEKGDFENPKVINHNFSTKSVPD